MNFLNKKNTFFKITKIYQKCFFFLKKNQNNLPHTFIIIIII